MAPIWLLLLAVIGTSTPVFASSEKVVVVVLGGRASCGAFQSATKTRMTTYLTAQAEHLRSEGKDVATISACIDGMGNKMVIELQDRMVRRWKVALADAESQLLDILAEFDGVPMAITGHSYGGYLALQLARPSNRIGSVRFLATLDPISFETCRPRDFLFGAVGCRQFPASVPTNEQIAIHENVGFWMNIYQNGFSKLHSGPAAGAQNSEYFGTGMGAHDALAWDVETVNQVTEALVAH